MEFMMIRSVKSAAAGTSGSDLQKSTLGLLSGGAVAGSSVGNSNHQNNLLYQNHRHGSTSSYPQTSSGGVSLVGVSHSHPTQPFTSFHVQNSYGDKPFPPVAANHVAVNHNWNLNNGIVQASGATSQNAFENHKIPQKKNSGTRLPILIKSRATLDRIKNPHKYPQKPVYEGVSSGRPSGKVNCNSYGRVCDGQNKQQPKIYKSPHVGNLQIPKDKSKVVPRRRKRKVKKKMGKKTLWENTFQKSNNDKAMNISSTVTLENVIPWQPEDLVDEFSLFSSTKKKKKKLRRHNSPLRMPNLLKSLSNNGKLGEDKQKKTNERQLVKSINSSKSPGTSTSSGRTGISIGNVFLQKYDPIKLLRRLRCSTSRPTTTAAIVQKIVAPTSKKKKIIFNDFPFDTSDNPTRESKSNFPKNKNKSDGIPDVCYVGGSVKRAPRIIRVRKTSRPPKPLTKQIKRPVKVRWRQKCEPKKNVNVKYKSTFNNKIGTVSEMRLRIMAAFYLKRALYLQRRREQVKSSVIKRRLNKLLGKTTSCKYERIESTGGFNILKSDSNKTVKSSKTFPVSINSLPRPIPIEKHTISLTENPYLLHTLQLLQHKRELQERLETMETDGSVQKVGPLPEKPQENIKFPFLTENVAFKKREVKHVISQKLLICLATVGFTHTKLRPLEVMADATSNFLTKMAQRLKEVSELEMYETDHGFPDSMERVLNEQGFGGIRGLEEFYRTKVIDYGHRMEEQCLVLRRQYAYKVRSKVGMMSNVNTSTNSSISSSSVTTNSAPSSSTTSSISSTATLASPSVMVVSGGGSTSTAVNGAVASKSSFLGKTSSSTSQPLSPGNSVLAEMLSSQEDLSMRTPQGCPSPSLGMMVGSGGNVERQLEELMGAPPPNVEIRPNSFPQPHSHQHRQPLLVLQQQQQQQVPLHQLLASLSQQQQSPQSRQQQQSNLPPSSPQQAVNPYALYASSPPLTPPTPPQHLNQKLYHQPLQSHQAHTQSQSNQAHSQNQSHQVHSQSQSHQAHLQSQSQQAHSQNQSHQAHLQSQSHQAHLQNQPHQVHLQNQHHQAHLQNQSHLVPNQGQPQNTQSHLTQLLQRPSPITNQHQPNPTLSGAPQVTASSSQHLVHHHHQPQQSAHHLYASPLTSPTSQQSPLRSTNINTTTLITKKSNPHHPNHQIQTNHLAQAPTLHQSSRQLGSQPLHLNPKVPGHHSSLASGEPTYSSSPSTPSVPLARTPTSSNGDPSLSNSGMQSGGKLITIIRSSQQQTPNNDHHHNYHDASSGPGSAPDDVISINLGGTVEDAGGDVSNSPTASTSTSSSKAKLKEAISQRNLLRLNFEQVPSGAGDSTVLLSSSSVAASSASPATNATNSVQFLGKVSGSTAVGGHTIPWNNTTNYS